MLFKKSIVLKCALHQVLLVFVGVFGVKAFAHGPQSHNEVPLFVSSSAVQNGSGVLRKDTSTRLPASMGGQWSQVYDWPLVAVHANLLSNGKVLAWDATPDDADDDPHTTDNYTTRVTLWDPISNTHTATNNDTDTDLFCAGSAHLWDGRILFAGGDGGREGSNGPLANSNIYNPNTNTWHRTENMNAPRWYSSVAALANGEMLTFGGSYMPNPTAEVFRFDQTWRGLNLNTPLIYSGDYQWIQTTPQGSVLSFGPNNVLADINSEGGGSFNVMGNRDDHELRDYGSYAMFDVGKILVSGGGGSLSSAVVIDTQTHQTQDTGSMHTGRRQHNLTIMADGSVVVTGGNNDGTQYVSEHGGVRQVEQWLPASGQWQLLNAMQTIRQYHSTALLLPDGRLLSAGGGICGICSELGYEEKNAELFSPPYLFNADNTLAVRPTLSQVPSVANYGQRLLVGVDNAESIDKINLIKLGASTHSENQDQRLVPLVFKRYTGSLAIEIPESRSVAPPGHYMLFVINAQGTPSIAPIIQIGQPLLESGSQVLTTLEPNAWDRYAIKTEPGIVNLSVSSNERLELSASFARPNEKGHSSDNLCSVANSSASTPSCSFRTQRSAILYVTLHAAQRGEYRLRVDVQPSQTEGANVDTGAQEAAETDNGSSQQTGAHQQGVAQTGGYGGSQPESGQNSGGSTSQTSADRIKTGALSWLFLCFLAACGPICVTRRAAEKQ